MTFILHWGKFDLRVCLKRKVTFCSPRESAGNAHARLPLRRMTHCCDTGVALCFRTYYVLVATRLTGSMATRLGRALRVARRPHLAINRQCMVPTRRGNSTRPARTKSALRAPYRLMNRVSICIKSFKDPNQAGSKSTVSQLKGLLTLRNIPVAVIFGGVCWFIASWIKTYASLRQWVKSWRDWPRDIWEVARDRVTVRFPSKANDFYGRWCPKRDKEDERQSSAGSGTK